MKKVKTLTAFLIIAFGFLILSSCKKEGIKDSVAPVITLNGPSLQYVEKGTVYSDMGATAYDETDGDLTSSINAVSFVDTQIEATYYVRYNVSDAAGNKAAEVVRTVIVKIF